MARPITIGIDLGTTYSGMAYVNEHGQAEIIPNREGERCTPSVVLFDGETPIVGSIAKRSAVASPLNVCQFVKRQMGEKDWRFLTEDDRSYTAEEISALILKRLVEDAAAAMDCEISSAVITVPAYFNDAQRKATQDAGKIAGLDVLRIMNEPTAAALAYGIDKTKEPQTVMVYDLGGGTFDVTIMNIAQHEIEVIATGGDKNLGGFDWDNKVMEFLNDQFQKSGGRDLLDDLALQQDLRDKAEIGKKTLSSRDCARVFLSAEGKNVTVELSRQEFEQLTADLLKRTETLMEMTLEDAKMDWGDIHKILMVGGSTRMKSVPALIEKIARKKPSAELHPDEIVAVGAGLLGAILQKESCQGGISSHDSLPSPMISDVNSHSLGVVALDSRTGKPYNSIILPKDTKIATRASNIYLTLVDDQTEIEVEVTEGEEEDLDYVRTVGKGTMRIPPYPKGAPVEVFFQYDNDGIIYVTVFDRTADKMLGELRVERQANRSGEEISQMRKQIESINLG